MVHDKAWNVLKAPDTTPFLFTICQAGAEKALKQELTQAGPYKFAYSRPGFVTFKWDDPAVLKPNFELRSIFARAYGVSVGKVADPLSQEVLDFATLLKATHPGRATKLFLHAWERKDHLPGDEPKGFVVGKFSNDVIAELMKNPIFSSAPEPSVGDTVLDLVWVDEGEWWVGYHQHHALHSPFAGGAMPLELPQDAPSRAYLKLEEAIRWSGAKLAPDEIAVEIGSAPGGASYALLQRGLKVIGIDPGEMAPVIAKNPNFKHFPQVVNSVLREDLPADISWLLLDMNVEPRISVFALDRLAHRTRDTLNGMFLTIKLNQWEFAREIPAILDHVKAMGMVKVRAAQLSQHRQEFLIFALTRKGGTKRVPAT